VQQNIPFINGAPINAGPQQPYGDYFRVHPTPYGQQFPQHQQRAPEPKVEQFDDGMLHEWARQYNHNKCLIGTRTHSVWTQEKQDMKLPQPVHDLRRTPFRDNATLRAATAARAILTCKERGHPISTDVDLCQTWPEWRFYEHYFHSRDATFAKVSTQFVSQLKHIKTCQQWRDVFELAFEQRSHAYRVHMKEFYDTMIKDANARQYQLRKTREELERCHKRLQEAEVMISSIVGKTSPNAGMNLTR
jgi:hypothetical protein